MQYRIVFLFGGFVGVFSSMLSVSYTNKGFDITYDHLQDISNICATANSTPVSFDKYEVTCKNGAVMKITNSKE